MFSYSPTSTEPEKQTPIVSLSRFASLLPALASLCQLLTARATETAQIAPEPSWILPAPAQVENTKAAEGGSYHYQLVDLQHHLEEHAYYSRYTISILNESGVEDYSQLSFDFQPEYETLQLHHITVTRGGETQDRLTNAKIETFRREKDLDEQLYDGALTAHIILNDIRPGDQLSYSFTYLGENPVHSGHVHSFAKLGYNDEIDFLRRRILWNPATRSLHWHTLGDSTAPIVCQKSGPLVELLSEQTNTTQIFPEDNTPSYTYDYPYLEYSDFPDWETYAQHAATHFQSTGPLPAELTQICAQIRQKNHTDEEQITATLRWVQQNIRYLGSFIGEHTHRPHTIKEIFEHRFGDCKDKTLLTTSMLRHLGFDAAPALVNTSARHRIKDYLPGYAAFNHLIVHLRFQNNDYFLDPTYTYQRGPLNQLGTTDYGFALPLRPDTRALTPVTRRGIPEEKTTILESYTSSNDYKSAELEVTTIATGGDANSLRSYLSTHSIKEIQKDYLDFYTSYFSDAYVTQPVTYTDDEKENRIEVHEYYFIPTFWKASEKTNQLAVNLNAGALKNYLTFPNEKKRLHPYRIGHPYDIKQTIEVHLPQEWTSDVPASNIEQPTFNFTSEVNLFPKGIRGTYHYRSRADSVQPGDFIEFAKSMDQLDDDLRLSLTYTSPQDSSGSQDGVDQSTFGAVLLTSALMLGFALGTPLAIALYFWDPRARSTLFPAQTHISGWLILPALYIFIAPIVRFFLLASYFANLSSMGSTLASDSGFSEWRIYYFLGVFLPALVLPTTILLIVLLLKKRTSVPYIFIAVFMYVLISDICLTAMLSQIPNAEDPDAHDLPRTIIYTILWSTYMLRSSRVKATFIRRRRHKTRQSPPPLPPAQIPSS